MELGPKGKQTQRSVLDADIRIITLPNGRDPDELIIESPDVWQGLVDTATPYVDFYVDTLVQSIDTSTARGKRELIAACEPVIAELEDAMDRSRFYSRLSRALKLPERDLMSELSRVDHHTATSRSKQSPAASKAPVRSPSRTIEEYCLCLLLTNPSLRELAARLECAHFDGTENRQLYEAWQKDSDPEHIRSALDATLVEHLDFLLSRPFPPGIPSDEETQKRALDECILRLQERQAKRHQFMMETTLEQQRQEQGLEAELATLDQAGMTSNEQLHQIFLQRDRKAREKRG